MTTQNYQGELVTAIDVGSSKITIAQAMVTFGHIDILDIVTVPSAGLRHGLVTDKDRAISSIRSARDGLQKGSTYELLPGTVALSGMHLRSFGSRGMAVVREEKVDQQDIDRAIEAANASPVAEGEEVLASLVQEYAIDGNTSNKSPLGSMARRVEASVLRMLFDSRAVMNFRSVVQGGGIQSNGLIPQSIAAGRAVLTERELERGICVIDIGAGKTDVAAYWKGTLRHLFSIPVGGYDITAAVASAFHIGFGAAEEIKISSGIALEALCESQLSTGALQLDVKQLAKVIQEMIEPLLCSVRDTLVQAQCWDHLELGVVLTGGTANLAGLIELCEEVFHSLARIGTPRQVGEGNDLVQRPEHAVVIGSLLDSFSPISQG